MITSHRCYLKAIVFVLLLSFNPVGFCGWTITEITNQAPRHAFLDISGSNVVWPDGRQIMLYDGSQVRRIPSDGHVVYGIPQVEGSNIVWWGDDGVSNQIYLYDGSSTQSITQYTERYYAQHYQFSDSQVVWNASQEFAGWNAYELFTFDVRTRETNRVTNNSHWDGAASVAGDYVAWIGHTDPAGDEMSVLLGHGNETVHLDRDIMHNSSLPTISWPRVAWASRGDIFEYDITTQSTTQLSDDPEYQFYFPQSSSTHTTWVGRMDSRDEDHDSDEYERVAYFYYDGNKSIRVVEDFDDNISSYPSMSESNLVWSQSDGDDTEIFLFDGVTIHQITDNTYDDKNPQISGSYITWQGLPEPNISRSSIFITSIPEPSPLDFNHDLSVDVEDIDALVREIADGTHLDDFDLTGEGLVDDADLDQWLSRAATHNGFQDGYLLGDSNLDGTVNSADLNNLGVNWYRADASWSGGDFTADGVVDSTDLNELGFNWQLSITVENASNHAVPEPAASWLLLLGVAILVRRIR